MYENQIGWYPKDFLKAFNKHSHDDYQSIQYLLRAMLKEKLITKTANGYKIMPTERSHLLYQMLQYCIQNELKYNYLFHPYLIRFVAQIATKPEFTSKDGNVSPRLFNKYVDILQRSGYLLIKSRKPFKAKILMNAYLLDVLEYFGHRIKSPSKRINYLALIYLELKKFEKLLKTNLQTYKRIMADFQIRFIQHSLNLEGNPVTLTDTERIVKNLIVPSNLKPEHVEEVRSYQRAVEEMIQKADQRQVLDIPTILHYHQLGMGHKPDFAGKIRSVPVHIRGNPNFKVAKPEEIQEKLEKLIALYNTFIKGKRALAHIFEFAAFFHNEFQHIHPFEDGNSRTTRLITFHLIRTLGIPILDIPLGLLQDYLDATKASKKRNDAQLETILQYIAIYNLKSINEKMQ
jgi:fido (protein-threonine AMPylation protein)